MRDTSQPTRAAAGNTNTKRASTNHSVRVGVPSMSMVCLPGHRDDDHRARHHHSERGQRRSRPRPRPAAPGRRAAARRAAQWRNHRSAAARCCASGHSCVLPMNHPVHVTRCRRPSSAAIALARCRSRCSLAFLARSYLVRSRSSAGRAPRGLVPRPPRRPSTLAGMQRIIGTEVEYGISSPSDPTANPILTSTQAVLAYAAAAGSSAPSAPGGTTRWNPRCATPADST